MTHKLKQYVSGKETRLFGSSALEVISSAGDNRTSRFKLVRRTCADEAELAQVVLQTEQWFQSNDYMFVGYTVVDDKGRSLQFEPAPAFALDMCLITWRCTSVCADFEMVAIRLAEKAELGIVQRTSELTFSAVDVTITLSDFHDVPNSIGPSGTGSGQFVASGHVSKLLLFLISLKQHGCGIEICGHDSRPVASFEASDPFWVDVRPLAVRLACALGIVKLVASTQPAFVW